MKKILLPFLIICSITASAQRKDYLFKLETPMGSAHFVLYDDTPLHKANFLKLVKTKFYDDLLFHRVIKNFMVQAGDPTSKNAEKGAKLGMGGASMERIPAEFKANHVHKKGALAAARDGNREKKSSACQFYLVQGKKMSDEELTKVEKNNKLTYTTQQRADYIAVGGTPFLDNEYTVFGELIENYDLVDKLTDIVVDGNNRPEEDLKIKITAKKVRKKRISKKFKYAYPK